MKELVSYYQIAISDVTLEHPVNAWSRQHIRQGFVWRPRSVTFGTLDIWMMDVEVPLARAFQLRQDATRAIRVPFTVLPSSRLEVATVGGYNHPFEIPAGEYALTYEHAMSEVPERMWCVFTFVPDVRAEPAILIADAELSPSAPLLMDAEPLT